ncbi:MAG TPA: hypothetical protein VHM02_16055, partial [Thermoanaerobaculia bacterium]|nr:hypothetical protein [Thermoanaerobaculia bacterium]
LAPAAGADHAPPAAPYLRHDAPRTISEPGAATFGAPFLVTNGSDHLLAVWNQGASGWWAQLFDADGDPIGQAGPLLPPIVDVADVAMGFDGRRVAIWVEGSAVHSYVSLPEFDFLKAPVRVDSGEPPPGTELLARERPMIVVGPGEHGMAMWVERLIAPESGFESEFRRLVSRRVTVNGEPIGPEVERAVWLADQVPFQGGFHAAVAAGGHAFLAFVEQTDDPSLGRLTTVLLAPDDTPIPLDPAGAAEDHPSHEDPRVAADGHGSFAVAFTGGAGQGPDGRDGSCTGAFVRFYAADGRALAPERRAHPETLGCQGLVDVAGLSSGGWVVLWSGAPADPHLGTDASREGHWLTTYDGSGNQVGEPVRLLPPVGGVGSLPRLVGGFERAAVAEQRFERGVRLHMLRPGGDAACPPPGPSAPLCLGGGRFRVDLAFRDPYNGGPIGDGQPVPLAADTGSFWFFRDDNLELMLKVLDGRPVNGHWWVFFGGLTTVEAWIDVSDLATGRQRSYYDPPFVQSSRADTAAFLDTEPAGEGALTAPPAAAAPAPAVAPSHEPPGAPAPLCSGGPERLCLAGRFAVEVEWHDPRSGGSGKGQRAPINAGSGAFWFFHPANLELLVKVIDGRLANGHWWVFHGGLSDVEYTITVTDGFTNRQVRYHSPPFELTGGADTAAFPDPSPPAPQ